MNDPMPLIKKQIAIQQCVLDGLGDIVNIIESEQPDCTKGIMIEMPKSMTEAQIDIIKSQPLEVFEDDK